ncbi:hypothetical protein PUN28_014152 [Cardiocondyla obscurior]|uniref:Uncharacterized protein n=1 Tax=Cardiocondyla obscurior TaxID=286306 RepID=A0AAW2F150_9HYME
MSRPTRRHHASAEQLIATGRNLQLRCMQIGHQQNSSTPLSSCKLITNKQQISLLDMIERQIFGVQLWPIDIQVWL